MYVYVYVLVCIYIEFNVDSIIVLVSDHNLFTFGSYLVSSVSILKYESTLAFEVPRDFDSADFVGHSEWRNQINEI